MAAMRKKPFGRGRRVYGQKSKFGLMLDGLMQQGLDYEDAVETLKVGLRQAAGRASGIGTGVPSPTLQETEATQTNR